MTPPVFVHPGATGAEPGARLTLDGAEGHHAAAVRRLRRGEAIHLTDGAGTVAEGSVAQAGRDRVEVAVARVRRVPEPRPHLVVVQALVKGERAEAAVEALTEVGVDEIVPWSAEHCVARWAGDRAERGVQRWRRAAVGASKQARRAHFATVGSLADTPAVATLLRAVDLAVVLHEDAERSLADLEPGRDVDTAAVVVGPEGGLSTAELRCFAEAGATAYRMGPTVLRSSTAGTVAAGLLLALTGRWARPVSGP